MTKSRRDGRGLRRYNRVVMGHTYTDILLHCVWSTLGRVHSIKPGWQEELWAYIGGVARNHKFQCIQAGGISDHLHALIRLPAAVPIPSTLQFMKGLPSKWVHETNRAPSFDWQQGYAAFSVSRSQVGEVVEYIRNQAEHHKTRSFEDELITMLTKHGVQYDARYVFG